MKISNEAKIGALTIISVALLIIGFNFLKGKNLFSRNKVINAVYTNVDGLAPSNPVLLNGLNIGLVTSLNIMNSEGGKILVKLEIKKEVNIPKNSIARIINADLLGSKAVRIDFGNATEFLKNKDTIQSAVEGSVADKILNQLKPLSGKVQNTLASLDSLLMSFNNILDTSTKNNLRSSIASLSVTLQNLAKASGHTNELMENIADISGNLKKNDDTINEILSNANIFSHTLASVDLQRSVSNFDTAIAQLNGVMRRINDGKGSLGLLVNDTHLYNNLQAATLNLNRLLEDLRLNPKKYVHFSLFGKKQVMQPLPPDTLFIKK